MKKKFEGMLLASDFDGTLLDSSRKISAENREALEYFTVNGGYFTPATGRVPNAALDYCAALPVNTPCIFLNGAIIYDFYKKRILRTSGLPEAVKQLAKNIIQNFPHIGVEIFTANGAYIAHRSQVTVWHFEALHLPLNEIDMDDFIPTSSWCKVNLTGGTDELHEVMRYLQPYHAQYEMSSSNPLFYEITAHGSNKGNALLYVADLIGVSHENVFAAGDSYNDLSMLQAAAKAFVPKNADSGICAQADQLVSSNDSHAIRDVVTYLDQL